MDKKDTSGVDRWIPSKIERDLTNGPLRCDRAIRYSDFFGVRSVGPTVGDFLDGLQLRKTYLKKTHTQRNSLSPAQIGQFASRRESCGNALCTIYMYIYN